MDTHKAQRTRTRTEHMDGASESHGAAEHMRVLTPLRARARPRPDCAAVLTIDDTSRICSFVAQEIWSQ